MLVYVIRLLFRSRVAGLAAVCWCGFLQLWPCPPTALHSVFDGTLHFGGGGLVDVGSPIGWWCDVGVLTWWTFQAGAAAVAGGTDGTSITTSAGEVR